MTFALGARTSATGYRLKAFDRVGSTNAEAMAEARAGAPGHAWYVTDEQTAGRGRRNRAWNAPAGNLAASVLEIMQVQPVIAATLGFVAGLAIHQALSQTLPDASSSIALKWPNDVLAGDAKLVGILLEAETLPSGMLAVVAGIGVNLVAAPSDTPYPATSLAQLGAQTDAAAVFSLLSDAWAEYFGLWDEGRGFPDIRTQWIDRAAGIGKRVSVHGGGRTVDGTFETIDNNGCMIIATSDSRRVPVAAGEVFFGDAASRKEQDNGAS